ncbi:hypothetical protein JHK84_027594 [Glycine max]|nr:hypothetical protein JHK87_027253 [Glycine soja]KAG4996558.1 hypothetical protein JHK85_027997 [Glycine max]KAG5003339.1 hypothetical protein JHK86_027478 [Glycine max]KAG5151122.1 hypothetical protein JHK84_027594 [Glycine max]
MQRRWKSRLQRQFLSKNSTSMGSFSLFFWFMVKFFSSLSALSNVFILSYTHFFGVL